MIRAKGGDKGEEGRCEGSTSTSLYGNTFYCKYNILAVHLAVCNNVPELMYRTMYRSAVGIIACPVAAAWPFHFGKNCSQSGRNVWIPVDFLKPPDSGHFWTTCRTAAVRSGNVPEVGMVIRMPVWAILRRARTRRLATVGSATRNAAAMAVVLNPHTVRNVNATRT